MTNEIKTRRDIVAEFLDNKCNYIKERHQTFISCDREIAYLEQLYDDLYRVRHEIGADVLYTLHQRIELLRGEQ